MKPTFFLVSVLVFGITHGSYIPDDYDLNYDKYDTIERRSILQDIVDWGKAGAQSVMNYFDPHKEIIAEGERIVKGKSPTSALKPKTLYKNKDVRVYVFDEEEKKKKKKTKGAAKKPNNRPGPVKIVKTQEVTEWPNNRPGPVKIEKTQEVAEWPNNRPGPVQDKAIIQPGMMDVLETVHDADYLNYDEKTQPQQEEVYGDLLDDAWDISDEKGMVINKPVKIDVLEAVHGVDQTIVDLQKDRHIKPQHDNAYGDLLEDTWDLSEEDGMNTVDDYQTNFRRNEILFKDRVFPRSNNKRPRSNEDEFFFKDRVFPRSNRGKKPRSKPNKVVVKFVDGLGPVPLGY